jgi:hypothetical protein
MSNFHSDNVKLLDNSAGPVEFRTTQPFARLAVSGSGTLYAWTGQDWDTGTTFTGSETITAPGQFKLTLDAPGYASVQEATSVANS